MTTKELIENHPRIFQPYGGNPFNVNWMDLPKGWVSIVHHLCSCIQNYIDNRVRYVDGKEVKTPQVMCTQMKEKFAGLRFYYNGGDDFIDGMVRMASHLSYYTCEECGNSTNGEPININGWLTTLCQNCAKERHNEAHS